MAMSLNDILRDPEQRQALEDRLLACVDRSGGPDACWPCRTGRTPKGYGRISFAGLRIRANRVACALKTGVDPGPLNALHSCDFPPCANPDHVFLGTNRDNTDDMLAKGRGHKGMTTGTSKLSNSDVLSITADPRTLAAIAAEYGIAPNTVSRIKTGKRWQHPVRGTDCRPNEVFFECNGIRKRLYEWAADLGSHPSLIRWRLAQGWDHERALTQPAARSRKAPAQ